MVATKEMAHAVQDTSKPNIRSFPRTTISILEENVESLRIGSDADFSVAVERLIQPLDDLIVEASVLGYPRVSQLGRAVHASLNLSQQRRTQVVREALVQGLEVFIALCNNPLNGTGIPVASVIGLLKSALRVADSDLHTPLTQYRREQPPVPVDPKSPDAGFLTHLDTSIYSSAVIDSLDRCAEEESWTVAQLAALAEDLACETDRIRPAHRLMNVLRNHRYFQNVDRLCLAGLVHGSNQLTVIDSCVSQRLRTMRDDNPMPRGYSCFVNPQGSLFQMRPGVLRFFDDTSRVVESFVRQGKPPQRSIAHIADTGLKSGLCLAIGRAERVQGFLFMNSLQAEWFKEITTRFAPLLSLFSLLGTVSLDAAGFHAESGNDPIEKLLPQHSVEFKSDEFSRLVSRTLEHRSGLKLKINCNFEGPQRFLYLPRTIVRIVVELLDRINRPRANRHTGVPMNLVIEGEQVRLSWRSGDEGTETAHSYLEDAISSVRIGFREVPVSVDSDQNNVVIRFPVEPVFEGQAPSSYSVTY